jgi:hypothetical protein
LISSFMSVGCSCYWLKCWPMGVSLVVTRSPHFLPSLGLGTSSLHVVVNSQHMVVCWLVGVVYSHVI